MIPEFRLVGWLSRGVDVPVSSQVPNPRPERFVTVQRTGGPTRDLIIDDAQIDVFCWAESEAEAAKLAKSVELAMPGFAAEADVFKVKCQSKGWFPSSDGVPRYLLGYQISVNAM